MPPETVHDALRLDTETQALLDYTNTGRPVDPIVLLQKRDHTFTIIDGHHRLRVYNILHKPSIPAYVGILPNFSDPWTAQHAAQVVSTAASQALDQELQSNNLTQKHPVDVKWERECERKFGIDPRLLPPSTLSTTPWVFCQAYWPATYHLQPSLRLVPATTPPNQPTALFRLKDDAPSECRQKYATYVTYASAVPAYLDAPTAAYKERWLYRDSQNNSAVWRIDWFPVTNVWKGELELPAGSRITPPDFTTDELTTVADSYTGAFATPSTAAERQRLLILAAQRGNPQKYDPESFQNPQ